jgi:hypothetical protein
VHLTHLFNHCLRLQHFSAPWKDAKITTLPKPGKDLKFPPNLRPVSLLSTMGKLYVKLILRTIQKHTEDRNLLNSSQSGFRTDHYTTVQCMKLAKHVAPNFNNNMSTAVVFWILRKPSAQHGTLA